MQGNPARIVGYVDSQMPARSGSISSTDVIYSEVRGVTLHNMPHIHAMRGSLSVGEFGRSIPFESKCHFCVFNVSSREVRGEHAQLVFASHYYDPTDYVRDYREFKILAIGSR